MRRLTLLALAAAALGGLAFGPVGDTLPEALPSEDPKVCIDFDEQNYPMFPDRYCVYVTPSDSLLP